MSVSKKRVHTKQTMLHFYVRNGERFPSLLETNNAFRIVTQTYFKSEHMIDFCVKRSHTKRTTLYFFVGNEQSFPLLLGTNNALRIFMVLSETKSALVIKNSQRYCLLTVWNSDLFGNCFFGRLEFFLSGDITNISCNMTQVSGDMTSGEMTLGRLDWLPPKQLDLNVLIVKEKYETELT